MGLLLFLLFVITVLAFVDLSGVGNEAVQTCAAALLRGIAK
jgi:hypothetical protein